MSWRGMLETLAITASAILLSLVLFAGFVWVTTGVPPTALYASIYSGGFGHTVSWENTLKWAAPLILTALCTAMPARLGLVIIGGEGALLAGGLVAALVGVQLGSLPSPWPQTGMMLAGMLAGGLLIGLVGGLRHWRGVNATISSLLVYYIVLGVFTYLVEGPFRDPASLNKPSTHPIPHSAYLGNMGFLESALGIDVHWGLAFGIVACILAYILLDHSTFGFAIRMTGGNVRAAQGAGLPVGKLILTTCILGGAAAGLAGAVLIAASEHQANAALYAQKFGFTGILISFMARHHPLAILPTAVLFGGLKASSDTLQSRHSLPDASVDVLAGIAVVLVLTFETFYGRYKFFQAREMKEDARPASPAEPAPAAPAVTAGSGASA
jgi:simple sugar transport system permease protein